jgi:hypothetical protein
MAPSIAAVARAARLAAIDLDFTVSLHGKLQAFPRVEPPETARPTRALGQELCIFAKSRQGYLRRVRRRFKAAGRRC